MTEIEKEKQTLQTEEESTTEPRELRKKEKPKEVVENFEEDDRIPIQINVSSAMKEKIRETAHKRDVTRATIVREALSEYFAKRFENVEKHNPDKTEEIGKIEQVISDSTGYFGGFDFELFLEKAQEQDLVGDEVWSKELIEAYLIPKIQQTSKGILSDSLEDNCNLCIEALQLGEENAKFLAESLGLKYSEEEAEATEEPFKLT